MGELGFALSISVHFTDDEMSTRFTNTSHFRQHAGQVCHVMKRIGDAYCVEMLIWEIHMGCIHELEVNILLTVRLTGSLKPESMAVDSGYFFIVFKIIHQEVDESTATCCHIQDCPSGEFA